MRHRRLAGGLVVAGLVDDQRLAGVAGFTGRGEEAVTVLDAFEQADDRSGVVVFGEIGNEIADIDVAGISGREIMREPDTALHALQDGVTERAALRDDTNGATPVTHPGIIRHEVQPGARTRIGETDAVRADHAHASAIRKFHHALLRFDAIRLGRLRKT